MSLTDDDFREMFPRQFMVGIEVMAATRTPTADGYYWFKGTLSGADRVESELVAWVIVCVDGKSVDFIGTDWGYDLVDLDGLFIGPLEAPHQ